MITTLLTLSLQGPRMHGRGGCTQNDNTQKALRYE